MKALLYKDACVIWGQLKILVLLVALFCLLPQLRLCFPVYSVLFFTVPLFVRFFCLCLILVFIALLAWSRFYVAL